MSKKQSDSTLETLVSLATLAAQHPRETVVLFNAIQALGDITRDITTAALDSLFPRKPVVVTPKPQFMSSSVDEQPEAFTDEQPEVFTPAPRWPVTEDHPVGFVNGFFPVYGRRPGIFRL